MTHEDLWRDFPKTLPAFEARFPDEASCRAYLIEVRWGGRPRCDACSCERVWTNARGLWVCSSCDHQTSLTAGTPLHRTRKPLKQWFRAIWEMMTRRTGISGKDLQRLMGFGSYETAWTWLHKLRACLVRPQREPLRGSVQVDEGYLGGKAPGHERGRSTQGKAVILVAAEPGGRFRIEHSPDATQESLGSFLRRTTEPGSVLLTDGGTGYTTKAIAGRGHIAEKQTHDQRAASDAQQYCHWALSNLKRWWLGTHHGAISDKHLQAYLDEFTFRANRRTTDGVGRIAARALIGVMQRRPMPYKSLVKTIKPYRHYQPTATDGEQEARG